MVFCTVTAAQAAPTPRANSQLRANNELTSPARLGGGERLETQRRGQGSVREESRVATAAGRKRKREGAARQQGSVDRVGNMALLSGVLEAKWPT